MRFSILALTTFLLVSFAAAQIPDWGLKNAERQARELAQKARQVRLKKLHAFERLRKDLRYIADTIDREVSGPPKDLNGYSAGGRARIADLRRNGNLSPVLGPVLKRLDDLFGELPRKKYADDFAASLVAAIDEELRWAAEQGKSEEEILALLDRQLVIPDQMPPEGGPAAEALFPVDLPLEKFKAKGPIWIFLVKHRVKRPASFVPTAPEAIEAGRHNVQIGVEVEGVVNWDGFYIWDQDYTFNIGNVHMEITPEWRKTHPGMRLPKKGERVRVRGWTYFDVFHKAEKEYDPEDPVMGAARVTQWEIHPVNDVELVTNGK